MSIEGRIFNVHCSANKSVSPGTLELLLPSLSASETLENNTDVDPQNDSDSTVSLLSNCCSDRKMSFMLETPSLTDFHAIDKEMLYSMQTQENGEYFLN